MRWGRPWQGYYTDSVHASLAGQMVEAELASAAPLKLVK